MNVLSQGREQKVKGISSASRLLYVIFLSASLGLVPSLCRADIFKATQIKDIRKQVEKTAPEKRAQLVRQLTEQNLKLVRDIGERIVGDSFVIPTDRNRYMVALVVDDGPGRFRFFCGGTLISPTKVLTAAHCNVFLPEQVGVVAGRHDLTAMPPPVRATAFVSHADYEKILDGNGKLVTLKNDVAVITLSRAITGIPLVELAGEVPAEKTAASVIGWGVTSEGSTEASKLLLGVRVQVKGVSECAVAYPNGFDASQMSCAGLGGNDACAGDSGGPLLIAGMDKQVGIVSYGRGCGNPAAPGVYASVPRYRGWILSQ